MSTLLIHTHDWPNLLTIKVTLWGKINEKILAK